jgi:MFS family permease
MTVLTNAMKSGRMSDVYSPKPAFVSGTMILALTHLGAGFVQQKIALLVLRALGGLGSALTIPAALNMIVALYPDQQSQSRAIAIFGGTGAVGDGEFVTQLKTIHSIHPWVTTAMGLIIGALLVQYTTWQWIFYFTAIMGSTIGIACFILIPNSKKPTSKARFDFIGVAILSCERPSYLLCLAIPLTRILFSGRDPLYFRHYLWFDPGVGYCLRPRAVDHFCTAAHRLLHLGVSH